MLLKLRHGELEEELWLNIEEDSELHDELPESSLADDELEQLLLLYVWLEQPLLEEDEETLFKKRLQRQELEELDVFESSELQLEEQHDGLLKDELLLEDVEDTELMEELLLEETEDGGDGHDGELLLLLLEWELTDMDREEEEHE